MKVSDIVEKYIESGISVIPTTIKTKQPIFNLLPKDENGKATWAPFARDIADKTTINKWFSKNADPAVITGAVSGGLEIIDIDNHFGNAESILNEFKELIVSHSDFLLQKLVIESTQSGGYHILYRTNIIEGSQKLALRINDKGRPDAMIETKSGIAYALVHPSPGYELIQGQISSITKISDDERTLLIEISKSFNEFIKDNTQKDESYISNTLGEKPGNAFNDKGNHRELLISQNWKLINTTGNKEYWRRPGKKDGLSATFNHIPNKFYVFSANAYPFDPDRAYDKFAIYSLINCNGDFSKAAKELLAKGYGSIQKNGHTKNGIHKNGHDTAVEIQESDDKTKNTDINIPDKVVFWYETDKGIKEPGPVLNISRSKLILFLEHYGFCKISIDKNRFIYVRIVNNIVSEQTNETIFDYLKKKVHALPYQLTDNFTNRDLWETILKKITALRSKDLLETLTPRDINFLRDTKDKSYFFFKNGVVEVSDDDIKLIEYTKINDAIWEEHIIDHKIKLIDQSIASDSSNSMFGQFLEAVCSPVNPEFRNDRDKRIVHDERLASLISSLGYLCHTYKDPAVTKAVIFCEEKLDYNDNANGRTGKGLTVNAIGKMRKYQFFNGKNVQFENQFYFQNVTKDTQILFFDDVKKNFDFESLFSILTEGIIVEQKGQKSYKIPYKESPKIVITTNSVIANDSDSHKARKFEIEFADYFSESYTPFDKFQQLLFEWQKDDPEWDRFYNFMFYAAHLYLNKGLMKYQTVNLEERKLQALVNEDFLDFSNEPFKVLMETGKIAKDDIYNKFTDLYPIFGPKGKQAISQKITSKWFTYILKYKKIDYEDTKLRFDGVPKRAFSINKEADINENAPF